MNNPRGLCTSAGTLPSSPWMARTSLILAFVVVVGCGTASAPAGPDDAENQFEEPDPSPDLKTAYHLLQVSDLSGPEWPTKFEDYDLFVCNPAMTNEHLSKIRAVAPDAMLLANTNIQAAFIRQWDSPYYLAMDDVFDSTYCVRDLDTGNLVRMWPWDPERPELATSPVFIVSEESAEALVDFHASVTMQADWDGLYIDMCTKTFPDYKKRRFTNYFPNYDIDNDGAADTFEDIDRQYNKWRPYFTNLLRRVFPEELILGNSAGPLDDSALNGITLESVGEYLTVVEAKNYFRSQKRTSVQPLVSVVWVLDDDHEIPSRKISEQLDWVRYGVVRRVRRP